MLHVHTIAARNLLHIQLTYISTDQGAVSALNGAAYLVKDAALKRAAAELAVVTAGVEAVMLLRRDHQVLDRATVRLVAEHAVLIRRRRLQHTCTSLLIAKSQHYNSFFAVVLRPGQTLRSNSCDPVNTHQIPETDFAPLVSGHDENLLMSRVNRHRENAILGHFSNSVRRQRHLVYGI